MPYRNGRLTVPDKAGIRVELHPERVAKYAELYEKEAATFAFHESQTMSRTPLIPKF